MKIDSEIDRQLQTGIVRITLSAFVQMWMSDSQEIVSYRFVPESLEIPIGMFDERCVARGFARAADAIWYRGPSWEIGGALPMRTERDRVSLEQQTTALEAWHRTTIEP